MHYFIMCKVKKANCGKGGTKKIVTEVGKIIYLDWAFVIQISKHTNRVKG